MSILKEGLVKFINLCIIKEFLKFYFELELFIICLLYFDFENVVDNLISILRVFECLIDMIVILNFIYGVMENWGFIIYRDWNLFFKLNVFLVDNK